MNTLALHFVQSKNDSKLSEGLACAPGQVDESRVRTIRNVDIVVAGNEIQTAAKFWMLLKKVEELRPFRPCTGIRNVAGHENSSEGRLGLDC